MGAEEGILQCISTHKEGISISDISTATGRTRATAAKYLEILKLKNRVGCREVGRAKLWFLAEKRKTILIAEDEERIRRLVKFILGQENYEFIEAENGKEALEKVSETMPELIILDLMMPKIGGIEVCKQLKRNALTRKIPVLMLTAKEKMKDKIIGITAGADDYMTKPFEPGELRERVKIFLDKKERERNPVTNLPTFNYIAEKLKNLDKNADAYYLFYKDSDIYKKKYGHSKTNELIRLTSQIITHIMEMIGDKMIVGHDNGNNFIIAAESHKVKNILKEVKNEFESAIPFFYQADYESIDIKGHIATRTNEEGRVERIPVVKLCYAKLKKEWLMKPDTMQTKLEELRGRE